MDVPVGFPMTQATGPAPAPQGIGLAQLLALLRRYAWLIALCAVVGAVGAYAYARTMPKSYTASGLIAVEGDRIAIPELQGALRAENGPDPMPWVRTEVQAIASRDLLQTVIAKLDLASVKEFNPALQEPGLLDQVKAAIKSLLPKDPPGPAGDPGEGVLQSVARSLAVFQDNRSLVIQVSFTSLDPKRSADMVNTLVSEYIAARGKRRVSATQGANTAITERVEQVKGELDAIEAEMRDLRTRSELVGLRAGSVGQQQLEELATAAAKAGVERAQLQTTFDRATALAKQGSSDALASVLGSATIQRLRDQEATATRRVAELSSKYGSSYPGIRSAQADAAAAQRQLREETQRIVASLGTQLRVARQQEADVGKQLEDARRAGVTSENARAQLERLQRDSVTKRALYQTLLERAQQTVAAPSGTETPDVRVVSQAAPPTDPSSPNMKMAAGAGGAAGMMLGGLLALTRRGTSVRFKNPSDLLGATGLAAAASVPRAQLRGGRAALPLRVLAAPGGAEVDEMRNLRGRIMRLGRSSVPRSVVFTGVGTGSAAGEAAAAVAAAFARVAATDGDRVLLVEGNLHEPRVAGWMKDGSDGVLHVLERGGDWREHIVRDARSPLDLLTAAKPTAQAHALLGSALFQNLLVEAQARYDLVVVTSPPAATPDALTLVQRVDATVLVVDQAGPSVQAAAARLGAVSRNPLATVLVGA